MTEKKASAKEIAAEIRQLAAAIGRLRAMGVIRSQKIVGDVGEWVAAALFNGRIADSKNQKGWDVICDVGNLQVRAHAKAEDNRTRWTSIKGLPDDCAELAIVVLTHAFQIRQVFRLPSAEAKKLAHKQRLSWSRIGHYEVRPNALPAFKKLAPLFAQSFNKPLQPIARRRVPAELRR